MVVELHFGEGGDDSKNFVRELAQAYIRYAAARKLTAEILSDDYGHMAVKISGPSVWEAFQREPGKHVIQRCPKNDRSGRRHTSVISVAVLPLPLKSEYKLLPDSEIEIKTQRGHGKGGQHQNTTDSAVRAVHKASGLSVFINGRDQKRNKQAAIAILSAKVNLMKETEAETKYGLERREQLGNGSRGSKIRTYNLIDSYAKDHRSGKLTRRPLDVLNGQLELIL